MHFSSMEYFVVLAEERSFTKAAKRLHMSQQSLSSHIASMEAELGCQLVVRHIPLELTYAGEVLLRYAQDFRRTQEDMHRELSDIAKNQRGVLRIGAAATRGQILLPPVIASFQKSYPNIRIDLTEAANDELHQELQNGTLDLAIANFPKGLPGIATQDYYCEENVMLIAEELFTSIFGEDITSQKHQLLSGDFTALKAFPLVLGSQEDIDGRIAQELLHRFGIDRPNIVSRSHNVGTLLRLCVYQVGACFCPINIVHAMLSKDQQKTLLLFPLGEKAQYPIRFGFRENAYQWNIIERFMECAKEYQRANAI